MYLTQNYFLTNYLQERTLFSLLCTNTNFKGRQDETKYEMLNTQAKFCKQPNIREYFDICLSTSAGRIAHGK